MDGIVRPEDKAAEDVRGWVSTFSTPPSDADAEVPGPGPPALSPGPEENPWLTLGNVATISEGARTTPCSLSSASSQTLSSPNVPAQAIVLTCLLASSHYIFQ